ncbi:MAG: hypothetical protein L7H04_07765 [Vulcanisaeta sp.]|nr:hypothetical protein [Vulcanisaeta sp.]
MSEQAKDGQVMIRVEHVVNKRNEIVAMRVNVYVVHCFEEVSVDIKAFLETNAEKCMPIPIGSVTLFAGEVKSAESVRKKFNKIVDLITEARKFDTTLNNILSAVKDMAEGIKAKYEEKITLGEVV